MANDSASVAKNAAGFLVVLNGVSTPIGGNVVRVFVDGQGGNDTLLVLDSVLIAATVNGAVISNYDIDQRTALFIATSGARPSTDDLPQIRAQVLRARTLVASDPMAR